MKNKHLGIYGILIEDDSICLVKKKTGPYEGLLDLPGGSSEYGEKPIETLKREIKEEVGITVTDAKLLDCDSVLIKRIINKQVNFWHHIGIFYQILKYEGTPQKEIELTEKNEDSCGSEFYKISKLRKKDLSEIAILILENLGYNLN